MTCAITRNKADETKTLEILWDKQIDSFIIEILNFSKRLAKGNILKTLASVYETLRFISPTLLTEKVIYQTVSDLKIPWDKEIQRENQNQWLKRTRDLHDKMKLPRLIPNKGKLISYIDIICLEMQVSFLSV